MTPSPRLAARRTTPPRRVLVIAGFDPTGRAGLLADVRTLEAVGFAAPAVATALTAQGARYRATATPAPLLLEQLRGVLAVAPVDAVKFGMIATAAQLAGLLRALPPSVPWVVDPVVRTSHGEPLSPLTPRHYRRLALQQVVLTPNLDEARWLLSVPRGSPEQLARGLLGWGFGGVVVKSARPRDAADLSADRSGQLHWHPGRRVIRSAAHRGTGCRFASALAAQLALGVRLSEAATAAKENVATFLGAV